MSASSPSSQSISTGNGSAVVPVSATEIDASCRAPVLLLFVSAILWLILGSFLGLIASLNFHMPKMMGDCAWFTYGRVHPAHWNAFIYGFAVQAGLATMLWITAQLSRARLALVPGIIAGAILWNAGVFMGIIGIFYGESTGFEWLEMPRYASGTLFTGYVMIGLGVALTLHQRSERQLYISQLFLLAALFWFPWIYSTANLLLVSKPVRGVLQTNLDLWYANNLVTVWFGLTGLAAIFYFIPKIIRRPLHSHYTGLFIFWTLILFGSWGRVSAGSPLPSWVSALSTMGAIITVVPVLAVRFNVRSTMAGSFSVMKENRALKFFVFGTMAYVVAGLASAATSLMHVSEVTQFTWFTPAQTQLAVYGFFALTMFGAIYHIVPRLVQMEFPFPNLICLQFIFSLGGVLFYSVPLAIGGIKQGYALNDATKPFIDVVTSSLLFLRISTLGDLLMLLGHLVLALNLIVLFVRAGRKVGSMLWAQNVKPLEVAS